MERLYVFIIRNDIWIYILASLALVWYITEYWRSRRILKSAIFGLEKEKGKQIRRRALILIIFFAAIISIVTYVNLNIAPSLPADLLRPPTPTPNVFATRLSPPTPLANEGTGTFVVAPTVTLAGFGPGNESPTEEPQETAEATATLEFQISTGECSPEVNISSPPDGTIIQGTLTVFGTASADNFKAYSLAYLGTATAGEWQQISEIAGEPVFDGILGSIEVRDWPPGSYYLRLLVIDQDDLEVDQCVIALEVGVEPS